MKKTTLLNQVGFGLVAAFLAACQNKSLHIGEREQFQGEARRILSATAEQASRAFRGLRSSGRNVGGLPEWQNLTLAPPEYSADGLALKCTQQLSVIPKTQANYQAAMVVFAGCLNQILDLRNSLMTFSFRSLDPTEGQRLWAYLNSGTPMPYEDYYRRSNSIDPLLLAFLFNGYGY